MMAGAFNIITVLVVYTSVLLLIRYYAYPFLKGFLKRVIPFSIQVKRNKKEAMPDVAKPKKTEETSSVLGKSKFVLCQPLPHAATGLENEKPNEKEDTFAHAAEKPEDAKVNYDTGEGLDIPKEEAEEAEEAAADSDVDIGGEDEHLGGDAGPDDTPASGADFHELGITAKAIENPDSTSKEDEKIAGKVLSGNKDTQLVESIENSRPGCKKRITELMEMHERQYAESQNSGYEASKKSRELYETDEFKNFDINDIS